MLHHIQVGLRVIGLDGFAHDGGSCGLDVTALIIHLRRLLEKYFSQDLLFLVVRVVIFHIVVVWLVKDGGGVVVAVGILISDPAHLIHDLSLGGVGP